MVSLLGLHSGFSAVTVYDWLHIFKVTNFKLVSVKSLMKSE